MQSGAILVAKKTRKTRRTRWRHPESRHNQIGGGKRGDKDSAGLVFLACSCGVCSVQVGFHVVCLVRAQTC